MSLPLEPFLPAQRAAMDVVRRQAVLAGTLNTSGVLDLLPLIVMVLNQDRQIVLANKNMGTYLNRPQAELLGLRVGEALGCDHRHAAPEGCGTTVFCCHCGAARAILKGLRGGHDVQECRITRDDLAATSAVNFQFLSTPLSLAGENFLFVTMLDVSHEKRVELFERIFYHDVLDTSAGIHGLCGLLAGQVSGDLRDDTEILLGASARLVDQILAQRQFAAAENREVEVQPVKLGTRFLLIELADFFRRQGVAAGKRLVVDQDSADLFFETDKNLLYRVLANLTKNALEASAQGETVTLSCAAAAEGVEYSVHNPGVMDESVRLQLFTRFYSTKGPGRGLGTYSARLLTEEYLGGRLTAGSGPGQGTRFTVALPLQLPRPVSGASSGEAPVWTLTPPANEG
ncbi:MAG TPA: PAS domain-containing sensor histidine kinase [Humidesulfovibrio sp.]|nr:PAS domain-containing sensor histidine kinase [Humidesulfovibrio sp.]